MRAAGAASLRLPLARHPLRFGDLSGRHLGGHVIAVFDRHFAGGGIFCMRRRQVVPHVSLRVVLRHAMAVVVHRAEVDLPKGVPLFCGLSEPDDGLSIIPGTPWPATYILPRLFCAAASP